MMNNGFNSAAARFAGAAKAQGIRQLALYLLLLVGLCGSLLAVGYLAVNVRMAVTQIPEIASGHLSVARSAASIPNWLQGTSEADSLWAAFIHRMASVSIDLSAVTPIVLTIFFVRMAWGAGRCTLGVMSTAELQAHAESYPFHDRYETFWVQLGLLGTLAGLMIIGLGINQGFDASKDSTDYVVILLRSFLTALLSTFTAVLLAYVLAPAVIRVWRWIFRIDDDGGDVTAAVDELNQTLRMTSQAVREMGLAVAGISTALVELTKGLHSEMLVKAAEDLANLSATAAKSTDVQDHLRKMDNLVGRLEQSVITSGARVVSAIEGQTTTLKGVLDVIDKRVDSMDQQIQEGARKVPLIHGLLRDLQGRLTNLLDELRRLFGHEQERGDRAETTLANINAAIETARESASGQSRDTERRLDGIVAVLEECKGRFEVLWRTLSDRPAPGPRRTLMDRIESWWYRRSGGD